MGINCVCLCGYFSEHHAGVRRAQYESSYRCVSEAASRRISTSRGKENIGYLLEESGPDPGLMCVQAQQGCKGFWVT